jgi:hypothetical protein
VIRLLAWDPVKEVENCWRSGTRRDIFARLVIRNDEGHQNQEVATTVGRSYLSGPSPPALVPWCHGRATDHTWAW